MTTGVSMCFSTEARWNCCIETEEGDIICIGKPSTYAKCDWVWNFEASK